MSFSPVSIDRMVFLYEQGFLNSENTTGQEPCQKKQASEAKPLELKCVISTAGFIHISLSRKTRPISHTIRVIVINMALPDFLILMGYASGRNKRRRFD